MLGASLAQICIYILSLAGAYLHPRPDADAITGHRRASSVGPPASRRVLAADPAYHAFAVITTRQILLTNLRFPFAPDTVTVGAEDSAYLCAISSRKYSECAP